MNRTSALTVGSWIFVSQIWCQLLFGWLSNGFSSGLSEHAYRQLGGTAEQHRTMLRT